MPIACIQSGILRASADGVSQALRGVPLDMHHMAAYGTLGVLFSGLVGAVPFRRTSFIIEARDAFGNACRRGGHAFSVTIAPKGHGHYGSVHTIAC